MGWVSSQDTRRVASWHQMSYVLEMLLPHHWLKKDSRSLDQVLLYTSDRQMYIIIRTDESYQKLTAGCHLFSSKSNEHTPIPAEQQTDLCTHVPPALRTASCSQVLVREQLFSSDNETLWSKSNKTPFYDAAWILFYKWKWGVPLRQTFREKLQSNLPAIRPCRECCNSLVKDPA